MSVPDTSITRASVPGTGAPASALVIGGGFSGTSAALELARRGVRVDLVEITPEWGTYGAGISIGGPTLRALRTLGVLDRYLAEGAAFDGTDVLRADGHPLVSLPSPRVAGEDVPGNGAIMRPLLQQILSEAALAAGVRVHLGSTATDLVDDGTGVTARLTDGSEHRYDVVVGADGLYSRTRRSLFPDVPGPHYSGQGVWRAVLPLHPGITRTTLWIGDDVKVGLNPVSDREMYLFVNENIPDHRRVPDEELLPRLLALLEPFSDPRLRSARDQLDETSLISFRPLEGLLVDTPWHLGRIVLIGDAVHATTPHLAAGAGIGIEDAIVLADELCSGAGVEAALSAFEERRWERCAMVVNNSGRLGQIEITRGDRQEHAQLMDASFTALLAPI
ncbi:2-polyprenyl-6-methoxyphenol hydroxylase [Raineyella antarctica]|uniref:2-polyprenyl-6-methoxyphenol hydroxylase n=1 Tax=Raineyella antarctica TaxID=1577474 RepID=A0A1G6H114_9ACTN|nr:FAD-dependent oxidoreductase [Raineyella antarctica]SDB87949.1 2-polyprenyl-6-methoxyphenol hydroxylase [Raineyella antarctica]